jgi:hypothetical protein
VTEDKTKQTCIDPEIGALLIPYALGTLKPADEEKFELHVLHCPACQSELEEATPALDTLKSTREQFVERARVEDESFASQYGRLQNKRQSGSRRSLVNTLGHWLEGLGAILWGRRWIVGTASVVAIAFIFLLRSGPEHFFNHTTPQANIRVLDISQLTKLKSDTPVVSKEEIIATGPEKVKEERTLSSEKLSAEESVSQIVQEQSIPHSSSSVGAAQQPQAMAQVNEKQTRVPVPDEERIPVAVNSEVASEGVAVSASEVQSFRAIDLNQLADLSLGTLQTVGLESEVGSSVRGGRPSSEMSARDMSQSLAAIPKEKATPTDSQLARGRYPEAKVLYEKSGMEDSISSHNLLMSGIASLKKGEYRQAQTFFESADRILPPSAQKDNLALLLARTNILQGQLSIAKSHLQNILSSSNDPDKKLLAQKAIAQIDSFLSSHTQNQIPK